MSVPARETRTTSVTLADRMGLADYKINCAIPYQIQVTTDFFIGSIEDISRRMDAAKKVLNSESAEAVWKDGFPFLVP